MLDDKICLHFSQESLIYNSAASKMTENIQPFDYFVLERLNQSLSLMFIFICLLF